MGDGDRKPEQQCFDFDFICVCLGTNKAFLGFVTVLLNFIFPYKSYFYVVRCSRMRSDICYLIPAEENETY